MSKIEDRLEKIEAQQLSANNMLIEIQKQNVVTQTTLRKLLDLFEEESEEVGNSTLELLEEIANKIELVASAVQVIAKRK